MRRAPLAGMQFEVMNALRFPATARDVAARTGQSVSGALATIGRLAKRGLVKKHRFVDGCRWSYGFTAKGGDAWEASIG